LDLVQPEVDPHDTPRKPYLRNKNEVSATGHPVAEIGLPPLNCLRWIWWNRK